MKLTRRKIIIGSLAAAAALAIFGYEQKEKIADAACDANLDYGLRKAYERSAESAVRETPEQRAFGAHLLDAVVLFDLRSALADKTHAVKPMTARIVAGMSDAEVTDEWHVWKSCLARDTRRLNAVRVDTTSRSLFPDMQPNVGP